MYNIGKRIYTLRKSRGLTQSQACGSSMNRIVLSRIENNLQDPTLGNLLTLAKNLHVDIKEFFISEDSIPLESDNKIEVLSSLFKKKDYYAIVKYYDLNINEFSKINNNYKHYYLGVSYYELDMKKDAEKFLKKFSSYYLKCSENEQKEMTLDFAYCLNYLFKLKYYLNKGSCINNLETAFNFLTKYKLEESKIYCTIFTNICVYYERTYNFQKVIDFCRYFENSSLEVIYPNLIVNIYKSLSISYYNLNMPNKSIENTRKVIALYEILNKTHNIAIAHINIITALRLSQSFDKCIDYITKCKRDYSNDKYYYNMFLTEEFNLYFNTSDLVRATEIYNLLQFKLMDSNTKILMKFMFAFIELNNGNIKSGYNLLIRSEKLLIEERLSFDLYVLYRHMYLITNDDKYIDKLNKLDFIKCKKNIFPNKCEIIYFENVNIEDL
ncbi:MAG: helix-turn-helix domain-containing protein [Clostridium sp.]